MFERAVNYEPVKITKILYFSSAMVVDKVKRRSESLEDGLRFFYSIRFTENDKNKNLLQQ